jgi:hypothetical protein
MIFQIFALFLKTAMAQFVTHGKMGVAVIFIQVGGKGD